MKKRVYDSSKLPTCMNYGCNNTVHWQNKNNDRSFIIRHECQKCHKGGSNRPGIKQFKKDYCENIDGRLGFICDSTIQHPCQLDVDHKDGNRWNNIPENGQTLCKNCHCLKTKMNGDHSKNSQKIPLETFSNQYDGPLEKFMNGVIN